MKVRSESRRRRAQTPAGAAAILRQHIKDAKVSRSDLPRPRLVSQAEKARKKGRAVDIGPTGGPGPDVTVTPP